jgi:hypothetical protein
VLFIKWVLLTECTFVRPPDYQKQQFLFTTATVVILRPFCACSSRVYYIHCHDRLILEWKPQSISPSSFQPEHGAEHQPRTSKEHCHPRRILWWRIYSFHFIQGTATELDHTNRTVSISLGINNDTKIDFYALVIATGASTPSPLLAWS